MGRTILRNARVVTMHGPAGPRRGGALRDLVVVDPGHVVMHEGLIEAVGNDEPPEVGASDEVIDAQGRVALPSFVDCHTHACWAGDRYEEFARKLAGESYLDILASGGGIMATVRAVREATQEELVENLQDRLSLMRRMGTGAAEVKTGYGLNTAAEVKMLRAIIRASAEDASIISPTFLGAHAIDPDNPGFVDETITETLRAACDERPMVTCDAYCEDGAWSLADTRRLFESAQAFGCPIRVHADQFNSLGMTRLAVDLGAVSVDHLEASTPSDLEHLANSDTFGVMLPCSGFHTDDRYAPGRAFVDGNGALAIATNYNPGSSPTPSMPFVIYLAVQKLGLTYEEALMCATHNAACVLGLAHEVGSIAPGMRADVQLLDTVDERALAYEFAMPGPRAMWLGGEQVVGSP